MDAWKIVYCIENMKEKDNGYAGKCNCNEYILNVLFPEFYKFTFPVYLLQFPDSIEKKKRHVFCGSKNKYKRKLISENT
jgi:hypothetical protein